DPANFWKDELESFKKTEMLVYKVDSIKFNNAIAGFKFQYRDTGSSRTITRMIMFKDSYRYALVSMGDTLTNSPYIEKFFTSFKAMEKQPVKNIFDNRLEEFFSDLFSKDSATHEQAQNAIPNVYFGEKGAPMLVNAINRLSISDKDYFDTKTKLIAELGYIKDSTHAIVTEALKKIYEQTADTSTFQNEVLVALSRHKTADSYKLLKDLLLQDPPLFDDSYDYSNLFDNLTDSLKLTKTLYPDILQLASIDDYKEKIMSVLVTLVDSNMLQAKDYESYFSKIYFDARIELKKQHGKDEKKMEQEIKKDDDDEDSRSYRYRDYENSSVTDYEILLAPFYDKNSNVQHFFEKLLQSKDADVRLNTAVVMVRNNIAVPDSVLLNLAAADEYRGLLYTKLEEAKKLDKFPAKYKNQLDLARSYMVEDKDYDKIDSIVFLQKQIAEYPGKRGTVYFFKYRVKKEDDWKIGMSGLQPEKESEVSSNDRLADMTDKKIKIDEPLEDQLQKLLKKTLFGFHKSGRNFYGSDDYYGRYRKLLNYQDDDGDGE
ncbi:MAG TPA: hypothetical protein VKH37_13045, partial [Ferruginibacter sp.]|nr:hypothetical protein [Ferruginibacter sp.]